MHRRLLVAFGSAILAVALFALAAVSGCRSAPPTCAPATDDASVAPMPAHRLGWAPPGSPMRNYVGLGTGTATIKDAGATLLQMYCVNRTDAGLAYLQLFDQASAASGTPQYQYLLPPSSATTVPLLPSGQSFDAGLTFGCSTTAGTYTAGTAANFDVEAVYQ